VGIIVTADLLVNSENKIFNKLKLYLEDIIGLINKYMIKIGDKKIMLWRSFRKCLQKRETFFEQTAHFCENC